MTEVSTIGLDLAKNVFQVHGVDVSGETVIRPKECLKSRSVAPSAPSAMLLHAHASSPGSFVGLAFFFLGRFARFGVALNIVVEFLLCRLAFFPRCVVRG